MAQRMSRSPLSIGNTVNTATRFSRTRVLVLATAAAAFLVLGSLLVSTPSEGAGDPVDLGGRAMLFQ